MKPTRTIERLSLDRSFAYTPDGPVGVSELNRQELISAAKLTFPSVPGNRWFRASKECLELAVRSGELPPVITEAPAEPASSKQVWKLKQLGIAVKDGLTKDEASILIDEALGQNTTAVIEIVDETKEEPAVAPVQSRPQLSDAERFLAEAVRAIAAGTQAQLDPEQVRAIAAEEIEKAKGDLAPKVTTIKLGERPEITLEGRQHEVFPDVLTVLNEGCHVYLVGPAGTGKSTIAKQAAEALGVQFQAISLDPTLPPSRLFGYQDANGQYVRTPFREVYENGGVFLFDEIDNGHPGVIASINQALANGHCSFPDKLVAKHERCYFVAAANTHGLGPDRQYVGRNQLDAATLDRFTEIEVCIDEELEEALTLAENPEQGRAWLDTVRGYRRRAEQHKLLAIFSPRASIEGARLIRAGLSIERVTKIRLEKGLAVDVLSKVRPPAWS